MKFKFCLAITFLYLHGLLERFFSSKKNLTTRTKYPTKNTSVFNLGEVIVIVGIVSEQPVAQKLDDYSGDVATGNRREDTYFFIDDDFFDLLYFERAKAYQVATPSGEDNWKAYVWKPAMVSITGDTFLN